MKLQLNPDWTEFLSLLISKRVRFVLVGGHAVAAHGEPRLTEDLDVFVDPTLAKPRGHERRGGQRNPIPDRGEGNTWGRANHRSSPDDRAFPARLSSAARNARAANSLACQSQSSRCR